jgi:transcriptional regulator with XRE-family HTH domain
MSTNGVPVHPLKALRKAANDGKGMTQQAVASQAGCAVSYVCMAEKGLVPPLDRQDGMAAAVGATRGAIWP